MSDLTFQVTPADDGASATFEVLIDKETKVSAVMGGEQLQDLIDLLASVRLALPGSVPAEPKEGNNVASVDPQWRTLPFKLPTGRVLALRHNGLGWTHFIFSDAEASKIGDALKTELPSVDNLSAHAGHTAN